MIEDCSPYALNDRDLSTDLEQVPEITMVALVNYFVLTHSYYTCDQLKAYKSLQAYKYFEAGFVLKIRFKQISEKYVLLGEVKHSQRMNEKNLSVWLIVLADGTISSAHCVCMAGLGEVCSHAAAVIFALNSGRLTENVSCTGKLASWPVPRVAKKVIPAKVEEMDWGRKIKPKCNL